MSEKRLSVNEFFGPTFQGEGPDIGKPCMFLRLHHCPVQCPGCDTAYTWNGTEKGDRRTYNDVVKMLQQAFAKWPEAGLVLTGGEPLLHYKDDQMLSVIHICNAKWKGLETSGFIGTGKVEPIELKNFLNRFDTVCLSPKITPCLHGEGWKDEELCQLVPIFLEWDDFALGNYSPLCLKFVVRDNADFDAIQWFERQYLAALTDPPPIYVMPYGEDRERILKDAGEMVETCARRGYILTPRLHSLIWGAKRGI